MREEAVSEHAKALAEIADAVWTTVTLPHEIPVGLDDDVERWQSVHLAQSICDGIIQLAESSYPQDEIAARLDHLLTRLSGLGIHVPPELVQAVYDA